MCSNLTYNPALQTLTVTNFTDGTATLIGGTLTATTLSDGTTVADADRVVLNDNGTMVQVAVTDLATYFGGSTKDVDTDGATLTESDSGMVLAPDTETRTYTLPAQPATAGVHFTFIVGQSLSGTVHTIEANGSETTLNGWIMHGSNPVHRNELDDITTITTNGTTKKGDRIDIISNGTHWLINGNLSNNVGKA